MDPRWEKGLGKPGVLLRQRQPGISDDPKDFKTSQTESNRRVRDAVGAVEAAAKKAAPTPQIATPATPVAPIVPPATIIDRLHKESGSKYGGYITVAQPHDASETDQTPPLNPAYAITLTAGLQKAVTMTGLLKASRARVAMIVLGGVWNESLSVVNANIDIIGIGQPTIIGNVSVGPMADPFIIGIDFVAPNFVLANPGGSCALWYMPGAPDNDPALIPARLTDCRFYSDGIALWSQRRFRAEHCQFYHTSDEYGLNEMAALVTVDYLPPQFGISLMKDCSIHSWETSPDFQGGPTGGPMDRHPGGYALMVRSSAQGPYNVNLDTLAYLWPSNWLVLEDCAVYGSAFVDQWQLKHIGGHQHGSIPIGTRSGTIYAVLRGRPLFDATAGFYANVPACCAFDGCSTYAEQIATMVPYNGSYPVGVTPSTYPGQGFVQYRNSEHLRRWDGAAGTPFRAGGIGFADVVQSSTGATSASWATSGWVINLYGDCPVNCVGNRDFFLM